MLLELAVVLSFYFCFRQTFLATICQLPTMLLEIAVTLSLYYILSTCWEKMPTLEEVWESMENSKVLGWLDDQYWTIKHIYERLIFKFLVWHTKGRAEGLPNHIAKAVDHDFGCFLEQQLHKLRIDHGTPLLEDELWTVVEGMIQQRRLNRYPNEDPTRVFAGKLPCFQYDD